MVIKGIKDAYMTGRGKVRVRGKIGDRRVEKW